MSTRNGGSEGENERGEKYENVVKHFCDERLQALHADLLLTAIIEIRVVLRAISSSVLSLLVTITLFWGGCISCPQFFMFPTAEKSCCNKTGKCERPEKTAPVKECTRMPLELQGSSSAHSDLVAAAGAAGILPVATVRDTPMPGTPFNPATVEHSPPDLTVLHSTFLI